MSESKELTKQIPENTKEFRFADIILKVTKSKTGSIGMMFKNIEWKNHHYMLVIKDGNATLHHTDEDTENRPKQRQSIDYEKAILEIGKLLENIFKQAERLELTDTRFLGKRAILLTRTKLFVDKLKSRKVSFEQDVDYDVTLFENIDTVKNSFGALIDENEKEIATIFVNNGEIFKLDLDKYDSDEYQFDSFMELYKLES